MVMTAFQTYYIGSETTFQKTNVYFERVAILTDLYCSLMV